MVMPGAVQSQFVITIKDDNNIQPHSNEIAAYHGLHRLENLSQGEFVAVPSRFGNVLGRTWDGRNFEVSTLISPVVRHSGPPHRHFATRMCTPTGQLGVTSTELRVTSNHLRLLG